MTDERALKAYRIWIVGQKAETLCIADFESSFAARRWMARRYGLDTWDAVAQRIWDAPEEDNED